MDKLDALIDFIIAPCFECNGVGGDEDDGPCTVCGVGKGPIGMKRVATVLRSDPMDERDGPLFNSEDRAALNALRPGDRLYVLRQPAIAAWNTRVNPEPVAPPSPEPIGWVSAEIIAGLVERATAVADWLDFDVGNDSLAGQPVREAATALQRVAQERDAAIADRDSHQREAIRTMGELAEARARLFPYADDKQISGMSWGGFYLIGNDKSIKELRRIENAAAQIEVYRAAFDERIAAAEARIATARDEGCEEVAEWLHQNGHITLAAGIRALKNNKI